MSLSVCSGTSKHRDDLIIVNGSTLEPVQSRKLRRGDHIAVKGELAKLDTRLKALKVIVGEFYYHHGIYIGENEVVHVQGDDEESAKPKKGDLVDDFMAGSCDGKIYRVNYEDGKCLTVKETMMEAENYASNPESWGKYSILSKNCETFATYLKTGEEISTQGKAAVGAGRTALVAGVGVAAAIVAGAMKR